MYKNRTDLEAAAIFQTSITDLVEQTKAVAMASAPTHKRRSDVAEFHQKMITRLKEYASHIQGTDMTAAASTATLSEMAGLVVAPSALTELTDVSNTEAMAAQTEEFKKMKLLKGYATIQQLSNHIPSLAEQGATTLENCCRILSQSQLKSDEWAVVPTDVFGLVREIINQPHLAHLIDGHLEQIRRMMFSADELEQEQQQAVADGEMKKSEVLYFQKIQLQESMVEIFANVFSTIDSFEQENLLAPLKAVHAIHNKTNEVISDMIKSKEALKRDVQGDIKKLKETSYELRAGDEEAVKKHKEYIASNDRLLNENARQQDACFAGIAELEKRIAALGDERRQLVQQRLELMNKEQKRQASLAGFDSFHNERMQLLLNTVKSCEAADEATDNIDEFVCNACNSIEQHLRAVEADIKKRRSDAHDLRLSHFRGLYLTLGELQYKKERNLEELDKKIAHVHIQQDIAMDTFDPKAKEFAQMKKELLKVREEMESQLGVIQDKAVLQIEAFKPTEVALIKEGKEFLHPVQELEQKNEIRHQKLLEYHKLMGEADEEAGGGSPHVDLEEEQRAIEEARAAMQPRKPRSGGGTGLTSSQTKRAGVGLTAELEPLPQHIARKGLPGSNATTPKKVKISLEEEL